MSLVINDNEVISNLVIDSRDRKAGTYWNFICPKDQKFLNFDRVNRIALTQVNMAILPFNINEYNRYFSVTDGTNTYQVALAKGYVTSALPPDPTSIQTIIQNGLNANPYGWVFTVVFDQYTSQITWTSSVPTRVSVASEQILDCLGVVLTNTLSTSYTGAISTGTYSNVFYICSKALTGETVRDVHTNITINNIIGIICVADQLISENFYHVFREYKQLKVFDFEPSRPLGGEIDIYFVDAYGQPLLDERPAYQSQRITLEFKIVSTRNPQFTQLITELNKRGIV